MDRLMDLHIRAQRKTIQRWNDVYEKLKPNHAQLDILGLAPIEQPKIHGEQQVIPFEMLPVSPNGAPAPATPNQPTIVPLEQLP
jgi:hypothetical protein